MVEERKTSDRQDKPLGYLELEQRIKSQILGLEEQMSLVSGENLSAMAQKKLDDAISLREELL